MQVTCICQSPHLTQSFLTRYVLRLVFAILATLAVIKPACTGNALSGWHGVGSLAGMMISVAVIAKYIVPQILTGTDPLFVSIVGCTFVMVTTICLAHGFSKQTTVALVSTAATLIGIGLLSVFITGVTKLTGLGSDDAYSLKMGPTASINFRGLLFGGILIGALGVLDDVTTGLSASVFELSQANVKLSFGELTRAGLRVGREHINSLVNTLILAYAGASLPIFIYSYYQSQRLPLLDHPKQRNDRRGNRADAYGKPGAYSCGSPDDDPCGVAGGTPASTGAQISALKISF